MGNAVVVVLQQEQVDTPALMPAWGRGPSPDNTLSQLVEELRRQY